MAESIVEHEREPTAVVNVSVLVALLLLLAATVGLAMIDVDYYLPGHGWAVPIAMGIAAIKAALVVGYFMQIRYGTRLTMVFAAAGFVWLAILFTLVLIEVTTR